MIYIVGFALIVTIVGFYFRLRSQGLGALLLDVLASSVAGWIAGLLIGIGARVGMWSIPFFNGAESRITLDGTLQVVLVFSLYGIALGIVYELLFRRLLRNRGSIYGLLITAVTAYPLANAAVQQLSFSPSIAPLIAFALLFVGLMFVPFAVVLEFLVSRWHRFRGDSPIPLNHAEAR